MPTQTKLRTFHVTGRVHVDVGLEVKAKDMEEALVKAKEFKLQDFVEILGDHNDSSGPEIVSLWSGDSL